MLHPCNYNIILSEKNVQYILLPNCIPLQLVISNIFLFIDDIFTSVLHAST